ncbi:MAG TPA: DCC1-like thiol-disulfide oxidoreductase family protein [Pyrinomonadaceae bacterium]|nr:DCC1-like thiol-disulfide oxidoreductase family protein [Pyrinomonadaceae bacterium]
MSLREESGPVLLYDGVCGFCNKSVQTVLKSDRRGTMRFAALQSDYARRLVARHPQLEGIDSVVYVEPGVEGRPERVYVRSEAALRVASYLGGPWKIFLAARLIPRPIRDRLYDLFARHRYRLFGRRDTCMLPPPDARRRFLDTS